MLLQPKHIDTGLSFESFLGQFSGLLDLYVDVNSLCTKILVSPDIYKTDKAQKSIKYLMDRFDIHCFMHSTTISKFKDLSDRFKRLKTIYLKMPNCQNYYLAKILDVVSQLIPLFNLLSEFTGSVSNTFMYRNIKIGERVISIINPSFSIVFQNEIKKNQIAIHNYFYDLSDTFIKYYGLSENVYGFVKNKSCISNAQFHLANKPESVINLDINKFFNNCSLYKIIKYGNLSELFSLFEYKDRLLFSGYQIGVLSILSFATHNSVFATGARFTPTLSNLILIPMDVKIKALLKEYGRLNNANICYSRYADDITISSNKSKSDNNFILNISLVNSIEAILNEYGFYINYTKTKICGKKDRKQVNNINLDIVNNCLSFGSDEKLKYKMLYNNPDASQESKDYLKCLLPYIKQINPKQYDYIMSDFNDTHLS